MSSSGGSAASARATPTRCCWPPESCLGYRSRYCAGSNPTRSSISSTRSEMRFFFHLSNLGTVATLAATVMCGNRPEAWMA